MRRGVLGLLLTLTLAFGGIALTALPAGASHTVDHANFLCFAGLNQAENPFVITGSSGDFFWAIPEYYVVPASGNAFWEFGAWQYLQQGSDWREYPSGAFTTGQFFPNNISSGSNVAVWWWVYSSNDAANGLSPYAGVWSTDDSGSGAYFCAT